MIAQPGGAHSPDPCHPAISPGVFSSVRRQGIFFTFVLEPRNVMTSANWIEVFFCLAIVDCVIVFGFLVLSVLASNKPRSRRPPNAP